MNKQKEMLNNIVAGQRVLSSNATRVVAVASGKGGVGKTNITTSLAVAFAAMNKHIVLFDGDLGLSNVNILLKVVPQYNLIDVMRKYRKMKEILTDSGYGFQFLCGTPGFSGLANITDSTLQYFVEEMMTLSFANILLIDTSAGVGNSVLSFLGAADDIIVVTTPEPTSMADAYSMLKVLVTDLNTNGVSVHLVVNRASSLQQGSEVAHRIVQASENILNLKVSYLGCVMDDAIVNKAVMNQVPILVYAPKSKVAMNITAIAHRLLNREPKQIQGLKGFMHRLISRSNDLS